MAEIPAPTGERRTGRLLATLIVVMIVLGGVGMTLLARRHWWMLPVASAHGVDVDRLIYTTFVVTGIVFVLVHLLLATFRLALRRARNRAGRILARRSHP